MNEPKPLKLALGVALVLAGAAFTVGCQPADAQDDAGTKNPAATPFAGTFQGMLGDNSGCSNGLIDESGGSLISSQWIIAQESNGALGIQTDFICGTLSGQVTGSQATVAASPDCHIDLSYAHPVHYSVDSGALSLNSDGGIAVNLHFTFAQPDVTPEPSCVVLLTGTLDKQ